MRPRYVDFNWTHVSLLTVCGLDATPAARQYRDRRVLQVALAGGYCPALRQIREGELPDHARGRGASQMGQRVDLNADCRAGRALERDVERIRERERLVRHRRPPEPPNRRGVAWLGLERQDLDAGLRIRTAATRPVE